MDHQVLQATFLQISLIWISMWLEIKRYGSSQNPAAEKDAVQS